MKKLDNQNERITTLELKNIAINTILLQIECKKNAIRSLNIPFRCKFANKIRL
jgi:hypothetical protein